MSDQWTRAEALHDIEDNYTKAGHPLSFAPPDKIFNYYGGVISRKEAESIAHSNNIYTLYRENRGKPRKNIYNGIFVHNKRQLVELDLCDVSLELFGAYAFMRFILGFSFERQ